MPGTHKERLQIRRSEDGGYWCMIWHKTLFSGEWTRMWYDIGCPAHCEPTPVKALEYAKNRLNAVVMETEIVVKNDA
jgi:hypothetical protein